MVRQQRADESRQKGRLRTMASSRFVTVETEWQEAARQINECVQLCIHAIGEPEDLTLGLIVMEAESPVLELDVASDGATAGAWFPILY
jgi:hypothetical protein